MSDQSRKIPKDYPPSSPENARIGAVLRDKRKERGLSQTELAEHLGISMNTLRRHETGNLLMRLELIKKAAAFLDVPYESLLRDEQVAA